MDRPVKQQFVVNLEATANLRGAVLVDSDDPLKAMKWATENADQATWARPTNIQAVARRVMPTSGGITDLKFIEGSKEPVVTPAQLPKPAPVNAEYIRGPFKADMVGGFIMGPGPMNLPFAEVRGWGHLSKLTNGEAIQDANLRFMLDALNEKVEREK